LVLRLPQFLHAPTENSKDLEKSTNNCDPYARNAIRGPKELPSYISAVRPLQNPRETHLHSCRTITDPLLPRKQSGFRHGRSAIDQVTLLTQDIEDSLSAKKKAGAVFVDLTAAYDTVWHRGLTCKLLQLLPERHMVRMIMEMVSIHSFTLTTGNAKRSRLRRLKNGVQQGSVLAPLLFNTYISDLPTTISRKYAYADDLTIMHVDGDWQAVKGALTKDMATLGEYLQTWKLKLKVKYNNETLLFRSEPKYLGVSLDRSLTLRRHLESLRKRS